MKIQKNHQAIEHHELRLSLPQRHPLLLIDRVVHIDLDNNTVCAEKNITCSEPCYSNLSEATDKNDYAYPFSLMIESFSQSASLILKNTWQQKIISSDFVVMFASFKNIEILGAAYPGDKITHTISCTYLSSQDAILEGTIHCGKKLIGKIGNVMAVIREKR